MPPRRTLAGVWACAACGTCAVAWLPLSLWPGSGLPAWPAASAALLTFALLPAEPRLGWRAWSTLGATLGLLGAAVQIAAIAAVGGAIP